MKTMGFLIEQEDEGKDIYRFLKFKKGLSGRLIIRLKKYESGIRLNGVHARTVDRLHEGDLLEVTLIDPETEIQPSSIAVPILYKDADVLVYNKPPFMASHPSKNHQIDTLANVYAAHCAGSGHASTHRVINRLDKNTSGALVLAKNAYSASKLTGKVDKTYLAVVSGLLTQDSGSIEAPIARPDPMKTLRAVADNGQYARTDYEVLQRGNGCSLVRCRLYTGRTHQIRVHMKYLGHPLAGDDMYGGDQRLIGRQALHCESVGFSLPSGGERVNVEAELYEDMKRLIRELFE